jgi:hypothetical protein
VRRNPDKRNAYNPHQHNGCSVLSGLILTEVKARQVRCGRPNSRTPEVADGEPFKFMQIEQTRTACVTGVNQPADIPTDQLVVWPCPKILRLF